MKRSAQRRGSRSTHHGAPQLRLGVIGARELFVDMFAGGGGTSEGVKAAIGRDPDIAINHDPAAIAMHEANHPTTRHLCESVYRVNPIEACEGRPVGGLWASPDCTHHSKAKGGKPRKKKIRGLAWVVCRWAKAVRPRVIFLENVEEWADWGPLDEHDKPIAAQKGKTFRAWCRKLESYGYVIEHGLLVAADYGAPTTRKRLFLIARRDGQPIVWPEPTHAKLGTGARRWRAAAEVIDWTIPCRSIFDRKKSLAEPTLRRIAVGVSRYVLNTARPFIVPVTHPRDARVHSIDEPLRTVTAANRGELALIAPTLVHLSNGERPGQAPRVYDIHRPVGTVVAQGVKQGLVAAWLVKHYGGVFGHEIDRAMGTVTSKDHHALATAALAPASPDRRTQVRAFLVKYYGAGSSAQSVVEPLHTATAKARFGLVTVEGVDYEIADIGMRMLVPRELFRAQSFGDHYVIDPIFHGKPLTKTEQIAKAGNSVPPKMAEVLVRANFREREAVAA